MSMIGETVTHPQYGQGTVLALYRNGDEWMVRFDSGLRFRRPRDEFENQQMSTSSNQSTTLAVGAAAQISAAAHSFQPMTKDQFAARQLVEALRVGVAPAQYIAELTIGLVEERAQLAAGLNQAHTRGGSAFAVIGDYGFGKSHIVELSAQEALKRNFLVATTSLDLQELPPHRSFDIYSGLMHNLRYPDSDIQGLEPLLSRAGERPNVLEQLTGLTTVAADPLAVGLEALAATSSTRQQRAWQDWLMGGRRTKLMNKATPRGIKFPSIYRVGHNARQIAYLLSGVSALARLVGYSGLCVLIDEAESYSLLMAYQRPKASTFFSSVIYMALQEQQARLKDEQFPQHRFREYPLAYEEKQSLFFLFTVTRSENRLPLEEWLTEEQILELEPHHSPQEIGEYLEQAMIYHTLAYGYEAGERQRQIRRAAAEHLALGMKSGQLSIRGVVRLSIELYDLLYMYPEYEVATLLDELRSIVRT